MKTVSGWIEIGGTRYDHDIVIHTDGSDSKRKKKLSKPSAGDYGHTPLAAEELAFLKKANIPRLTLSVPASTAISR